MEVHTHTHSERKKWTHYLWEFLMLFLAVFAGFLAENQREHIIEHKRAKEYAKSLLIDLQNDTADIRKASNYEILVDKMIDSLVGFVSRSNLSQKTAQLYYYIRLAGSIYTVDWNKATLNQLINSGNLRYFTNPQLVNKISLYNTTQNIIAIQEQTILEHRLRAFAYKDHLLMPQYVLAFSQLSIDNLIAGKKNSFIDSLRNADLPLQDQSAVYLKSFVNAVLAEKGNIERLVLRTYPKSIMEATEIMEMLKKEYHLK
jgi:hypothetical protein